MILPLCSVFLRPGVLKGAFKNAGEGLLTRVCNDRTRGNGFSFAVRVVRHLNRFPRKAVGALSP